MSDILLHVDRWKTFFQNISGKSVLHFVAFKSRPYFIRQESSRTFFPPQEIICNRAVFPSNSNIFSPPPLEFPLPPSKTRCGRRSPFPNVEICPTLNIQIYGERGYFILSTVYCFPMIPSSGIYLLFVCIWLVFCEKLGEESFRRPTGIRAYQGETFFSFFVPRAFSALSSLSGYFVKVATYLKATW